MIDIKNIDGSVLFSVLPDESAVFHEELMASDYVQLSWVSDVYQVIPAGAYIEYEGEKYKLLDNYTPTQQDECTYQYTPQFQSRVMNWDKQITPVYTYAEDGTTVKSREMDWEFTGSPADAMYIVKQAIKNETGDDWTIQLADSLPATITISSQSSSIFATLNTIASECDTEWWADKKTNTLYLSKCIFGDAVTLEVGDNVQVTTVTNDSEGYFTRFYAFGSTRNITQDYDGGQATNSIVNKRLTLNPTKYPNGYKDIKEGLKPEEVFVKVLYFDKIYPSSKLTISDVRARLKYRLDSNGQKIQIGGTDSEPIYEQYAIWYFQIAGFTFDESSIIEGLNLSASFESGQLASRDFELTYHKTASTVNDAADVTAFNIKAGDYEIVIDESSGTIIPGTSYIIPQDGDSLVLYNIVMPDEYVTSAQDELETELDKAMLSYTEDNNTYQMASDPTRFYENGTDIQMGQAVTFVNGGKSLSTRVQMVEKRLDLSFYQTIKVGNKIIKGNTQQLKDEVASVNQNLDVIKAFNELSSSLSQAYANAQREMIEGFASIKNLWTLETDEQGNKYAYTQYDIFGKGGITAYTSGKAQVPSIFEGIPFDNVTIWLNPTTGLVEVIGGTGGGSDFDSSKMWSLLGASTTEQINISHLTNALSGYATESWVQSQGYATQSSVDSIYDSITEMLSTKADTSYVNSELAKYVTIATEQDITAVKNFTQGLSVGASKHRIYELDGVIYLDGDLAVTGGITAFAQGDRVPSTILDGLLIDEATLSKEGGKLSVIGGGGASSWDELEGKPSVFPTNIANITDLHSSWDALLKSTPSAYVTRWPSFSEVTSKPTTLSGYGITDAYAKSESDGRYFLDRGVIREENPNILSNGAFYTDSISPVHGEYTFGTILNFRAYPTNFQFYVPDGRAYFYFRSGWNSQTQSMGDWYKIWSNGNDGSGSGLDSDLLDGKHYTDIINGNVASATKLQTARTIWGQSFDGQQNVIGNITLGGGYSIIGKNGVSILKDYNNNNVTLSGAKGDLYIGYDYTGNVRIYSGNTNGTGSEKMHISSSGNVGIGTTSPSYKLHVNGSTYTTDMYINGVRVYKPQDKVLKIDGNLLVTGGITQYSIDEGDYPDINDIVSNSINNNANVWKKTTNLYKDSTLPFNLNGSASEDNTPADSWYGSYYGFQSSRSNSGLYFKVAYKESQTLMYRTVLDGNHWGTEWRTISYTDAYNNLSLVNNVYSTGEFFNGSDLRNKNISETIDCISLDNIVSLPIIKFRWNNRAFKDDGRTRYGTIAQSVQKMLPELIYDRENSLYMDYAVAGTIFSISVAKSLKGTQTEVERLKERIRVLEEMLNIKHSEDEESDTLVN